MISFPAIVAFKAARFKPNLDSPGSSRQGDALRSPYISRRPDSPTPGFALRFQSMGTRVDGMGFQPSFRFRPWTWGVYQLNDALRTRDTWERRHPCRREPFSHHAAQVDANAPAGMPALPGHSAAWNRSHYP